MRSVGVALSHAVPVAPWEPIVARPSGRSARPGRPANVNLSHNILASRGVDCFLLCARKDAARIIHNIANKHRGRMANPRPTLPSTRRPPSARRPRYSSLVPASPLPVFPLLAHPSRNHPLSHATTPFFTVGVSFLFLLLGLLVSWFLASSRTTRHAPCRLAPRAPASAGTSGLLRIPHTAYVTLWFPL